MNNYWNKNWEICRDELLVWLTYFWYSLTVILRLVRTNHTFFLSLLRVSSTFHFLCHLCSPFQVTLPSVSLKRALSDWQQSLLTEGRHNVVFFSFSTIITRFCIFDPEKKLFSFRVCSRPTTQQLFLNCQVKRVTFRLQWTTIKLTLPLLQMREGGKGSWHWTIFLLWKITDENGKTKTNVICFFRNVYI